MTWETVIGLEIHAELSTNTKIFCSCSTSFGGAPNTQCCPVCTAMPGTLPTLNKQVPELALKAGLALGCTVTKSTKFDRKNYFYPDLPKAYQISQLYAPILRNGHLTIFTEDTEKDIRISEIHMEEDAGKLIHDNETGCSKIDYNRCGVPLIEIVTAPDFRTAAEVTTFIEELSAILRYTNVCDCKMQEGSLRVDVNLSVRPEGTELLGTRTEMKNLNSIKAISRAINYEAERQIAILRQGGKILQETRRWDDDKGISTSMRTKENANDYRYFPEPDLPPIVIEETYLSSLKGSLPELPQAKRKRYIAEFGLTPYEATMLSNRKSLAEFFEKTLALCNDPKEVSNRLLGDGLKMLNETGLSIEDSFITPEKLALLIDKTNKKTLTRQQSKDIFELCFTKPVDIEQYILEKGLCPITNTDAISEAVKNTLLQYPGTVNEYLDGKTKVFGFLVGQTMRTLKGNADPAIVNNILKEQLNLLQNNE